jgi:DNA phosphorothioation-dependent restriction protein DptG
MYPISNKLVVKNNFLDSYLPLRNKGNIFEWDLMTGLILSHILQNQIERYDFRDFRNDCKARLQSRLETPGFWDVLEKSYFNDDAIFKLSPLFLLFKAQASNMTKKKLGSANWRLGTLFINLLGNFCITGSTNEKLNFLEREMLDVLKEKIKPIKGNPFSLEQPYLPYLAETFRDDMQTLASNPSFLLHELGNTLRLYAFAYCSQLALNIRSWGDGEPKRKPLYFILDSEKASQERAKIQHSGYKLFAATSASLFPVLSALEVLQREDQKRPLWQIFRDSQVSSQSDKVLADLVNYLRDFISDRRLNERASPQTLIDAFKLMEEVAIAQFGDSKTERGSVNSKYLKELEEKICTDFIQARGRSGRVLVLNQDNLLLLTNLAIGGREKLRLHELLIEFERRGFYVDNQTKLAIVAFYERMGNVERMSDSGDAVYVLKTV